eukprot:15370-Rhodomonas_salina.7
MPRANTSSHMAGQFDAEGLNVAVLRCGDSRSGQRGGMQGKISPSGVGLGRSDESLSKEDASAVICVYDWRSGKIWCELS